MKTLDDDGLRQFVQHYYTRLHADDERARYLRTVVESAPAMTQQQVDYLRGLFPPPSEDDLHQLAGH